MFKKLTLGLAATAVAVAGAAAIATPAAAAPKLTCTLQNGKQVHVIVSPYFKTIAFAQRTLEGEAVIVFNPAVTRRFATGRATVIFTFYHECGHHVLGHTIPRIGKVGHGHGAKRREVAADCYAIRRMWKERLINRAVLMTIIRDLGRLKEDAAHPAGPVRVRAMIACLKRYAQNGTRPTYRSQPRGHNGGQPTFRNDGMEPGHTHNY